jgi:uncharacterized membrane protein YfcA
VYALSLTEWLFTGLAAVLIGFVKTGLPGVGLIIVIIMAAVFPAKESTGILLPMLIFADIFAVTFYRHHARWKILLRLFPPAIAGIISGFFFMGEITSKQLKPVMGIIILAMLLAVVLMKWKNVTFKNINIPFAVFMGALAGFTSMISNAAGPIMTVYLVSMDVEKKDFVGSRAWFFAGLNLVKIPFSAGLGLITVESLIFDAKLFPAILAGALGGYFLVNVIPQKLFNYVVQVLAAASAIYIIISSF